MSLPVELYSPPHVMSDEEWAKWWKAMHKAQLEDSELYYKWMDEHCVVIK